MSSNTHRFPSSFRSIAVRPISPGCSPRSGGRVSGATSSGSSSPIPPPRSRTSPDRRAPFISPSNGPDSITPAPGRRRRRGRPATCSSFSPRMCCRPRTPPSRPWWIPCSPTDRIGAAYGRQIPDEGARPVAKVKRLFNYPDESITKNAADRARFGLRTPFLSNAFAAYRRSALEEIGGFGQPRAHLRRRLRRGGAARRGLGHPLRGRGRGPPHPPLQPRPRSSAATSTSASRTTAIGGSSTGFGGSDREGLRYLGVGIDHLRSEWRVVQDPGLHPAGPQRSDSLSPRPEPWPDPTLVVSVDVIVPGLVGPR